MSCNVVMRQGQKMLMLKNDVIDNKSKQILTIFNVKHNLFRVGIVNQKVMLNTGLNASKQGHA